MPTTSTPKPDKPRPDFPLFPHASGKWAKKIGGKLVYFSTWSDPARAEAEYNRYTSGETKQRIASKPKQSKPHPDFPLTLHSSGSWCKKIKGKIRYFGRDADVALAKWNAQKDALLAGREPSNGDGLTLADLANQFLADKRAAIKSGELTERTYHDYESICESILSVLGGMTTLESLQPADFGTLRADFANGVGLVTIGTRVNRARVYFNYGYELIDRTARYGNKFDKPSRQALRIARSQKGKRMFEAADIRKMLDAAGPQLKAMILLGLNCGLGNADCARLTTSQVEGEWLDFPRPKTGAERRSYLWPETRAAIAAAIAVRPKPKDQADADRVFITKRGMNWEPKAAMDSPISKEMAKLLNKLGLKRPGLSFYALRHTLQTVAARTRDTEAIRYVMGHTEGANDMGAVYNEERPDDDRLKTVAEYVRQWARIQLQPWEDSAVAGEPAAA